MTIRSVLACIDGTQGSQRVIKTAIAIGQAFSAYVELLHVECPVGPMLPGIMDGGSLIAATEVVNAIEHEEVQRRETAENLFREYCVDAGLNIVDADSTGNTDDGVVGFAWKLISGHETRELGHRGRLFDLIVLSKVDEQEGGVDSSLLEAALFDTGRPVLIASDEPIVIEDIEVAVAWDGSCEAARSVGLALPILECAGRVSVVSISESHQNNRAADLCRYLSRHGIKSEPVPIVKNGSSVATTLIRETQNLNAGLLVMGAYGHTAIGEYLFGGVTRELLETGKMPLLLAH